MPCRPRRGPGRGRIVPTPWPLRYQIVKPEIGTRLAPKLENGVDGVGGCRVVFREKVAVYVERNGCLRMAKPAADRNDIELGGDERRCVRMTQPVECNLGKVQPFNSGAPLIGNAIGVWPIAFDGGEHGCVGRQGTSTEGQPQFQGLDAMLGRLWRGRL